MQRALDFDKTPALGVPLPFFLNIPIFLLLAGILTTLQPDAVWASRWSSATLALTHLWTLGVLGSAMLGALLQILAVACNVTTPGIQLLSRTVYVLLTVGTLLLVSGFLWWNPAYWIASSVLLGLALILYITTVSYGLWKKRHEVYPGAREILVPIRFALGSLLITMVLGVSLATALGTNSAVPDVIGSHLLWGLLGWGGLLLIGMSFQLIPIFQVTEIYPEKITKWLPLIIPILLAVWTAVDATDDLPVAFLELIELVILGVFLLWAINTFYLLWTRKRPDADATTLFWYVSMICLALCAPVWLWATHTQAPQGTMVLGVLIIVGVLGTVVNGMLYLIFPFLLWKHAQNSAVVPEDDPRLARLYQPALPKAAEYIKQSAAKAQWGVHTLMVICWLLASAGIQWAGLLAGPILIISTLFLIWNMAQALSRYRKALKEVAQIAQQINQRQNN
ncbi:hypothetical protein [Orrella sp. 11846]|uniref:hypothetical protein n=1 Tax=Orrella sp. 11846 TaxID=3409913 RepID=UPI003B5B3A37